jgi:hypothetical protein
MARRIERNNANATTNRQLSGFDCVAAARQFLDSASDSRDSAKQRVDACQKLIVVDSYLVQLMLGRQYTRGAFLVVPSIGVASELAAFKSVWRLGIASLTCAGVVLSMYSCVGFRVSASDRQS